MPRVVLTDRQRQKDAMAGVLAKYQAIYGIESQEVAKVLGMSRNTYRLRRRDPDDFTLREIKQLIRSLRIPKEEILSVIFE